MKNIIVIVFIFTTLTTFSQNRKPKNVKFGTQFLDTLSLPTEHNYIVSVRLYPIKDKHSKDVYNDPTYDFDLDYSAAKNIVVTNKIQNKNVLLIPPLKPNRFYVLETKYTDRYNIFGIFREMHSSQDTTWLKDYDESSEEWLKTVRDFNTQNPGYQLFFHPSVTQLTDYKNEIRSIDLNRSIDTSAIKKILFKHFEILNFRSKDISDANILQFTRELMGLDSVNEETFLLFFEHLGKVPDYLNLFDFYQRRLKAVMDSRTFNTYNDFESIVKSALEKEKQDYLQMIREHGLPDESILNSIGQVKEVMLYFNQSPVSTFTENYETGYKRVLVPDFGYVTYVPYPGSIKGGSPYVGIHISLSPANKDVPLKLSRLSFGQRFSIHTGVTLNSLAKTGIRDNFFSNYSLLLGGGYKILTQSTRLNFGGVLFKKTSPVSGNSTVVIQPYIGLSIDIEIRKWLENIIPTFTKNFKAD